MRFGSLILMVFGPIRTAEPYLRCHSMFVLSICPDNTAIACHTLVNLDAKGPGKARKGEKSSCPNAIAATEQTTTHKSGWLVKASMMVFRCPSVVKQ